MAIPASVQRVLDDLKIRYQIANQLFEDGHKRRVNNMTNALPNAAKVLFVNDSEGKAQVIIPADCFLDLDAFEGLTNRKFNPISRADLDTILAKHQLQSPSAIPQLAGFQTYVEERLLKYDTVYIDAQVDDSIEMVEIQKEDYLQLIKDATVARFAIKVGDQAQLSKDWLKADETAIHQAVKSFTSLRIKQRLEETLDIPPMPETARRIVGMRMDPDAETAELATLVEQDPGLAAQVISWANSAFYGLSKPTTTVEEAVIRVLGFDLVLNLALGLALGRSLSFPKDGSYGYDKYWEASVYCATLMGEIAKKSTLEQKPEQGVSYLSGLLHNFGYLVLGHVFPPHFKLINRHATVNYHISRYHIEHHLLGITREQISAGLMKQWGLPDEVCYAIRYQNEVDYHGIHEAYSAMLFVCQRLLRRKGIGDGPLDHIPEELWDHIGITEEQGIEALDTIIDKSEGIDALVNQLARQSS